MIDLAQKLAAWLTSRRRVPDTERRLAGLTWSRLALPGRLLVVRMKLITGANGVRPSIKPGLFRSNKQKRWTLALVGVSSSFQPRKFAAVRAAHRGVETRIRGRPRAAKYLTLQWYFWYCRRVVGQISAAASPHCDFAAVF
jgi:hypothetical protein